MLLGIKMSDSAGTIEVVGMFVGSLLKAGLYFSAIRTGSYVTTCGTGSTRISPLLVTMVAMLDIVGSKVSVFGSLTVLDSDDAMSVLPWVSADFGGSGAFALCGVKTAGIGARDTAVVGSFGAVVVGACRIEATAGAAGGLVVVGVCDTVVTDILGCGWTICV